MKKTWSKFGNDFHLQEVSHNTEQLPVGIYKINFNEMTGQCYITHVMDKFEFPYKIYGVQNSFIKRVDKTYHATDGNLGILMNGVKGTGKSVTAELICNTLNLPVLIIHQAFKAIPSFINEIQQDIILFFDEYEKIYNDYDHSILTVMDGVMNNGYRKVFLLTTNKLYINDNMLQRPGRIRYLKTFSDLTLDVITEIVDDKLEYIELREQCITFISTLETITIDIVKAIIDEVNIHNEPPQTFKDVFNVNAIENIHNVYKCVPGQPLELLYSKVKIEPFKLDSNMNNIQFRVEDNWEGKIKTVLDENTFVIDTDDYDEEGKHTLSTYKIERVDAKHKSFQNVFVV